MSRAWERCGECEGCGAAVVVEVFERKQKARVVTPEKPGCTCDLKVETSNPPEGPCPQQLGLFST